MFLDPKHAAAHLDLSVRTLAGWRAAGTGPSFHVLPGGGIRYSPVDLDEWMHMRRQVPHHTRIAS